MNVLYVDQPIGAGYSFGQELPGTLEEASTHLMRLIRRFLRVFPEYKGRDFYVAGESYGARSAVGVAMKIITRQPWQLPLEFKGAMLGVGFLFDLVDTINSADYLFYSGLLDENSRYKFASQFEKIDSLVGQKQYQMAAFILSQTVLNMRVKGQKTIFQNLTGFEHHGSISRPETPKEPKVYFDYANSSDFKKRIHVNPSRALDGMWYDLAMKLAVSDFFVDIKTTVEIVLNQIPTLFYTAEFDAVFPAVNLERHFRNLNWEGSELYRNACQRLWYGKQKPNELLGYVKRAYKVLYATVLFGGHYISLDRAIGSGGKEEEGILLDVYSVTRRKLVLRVFEALRIDLVVGFDRTFPCVDTYMEKALLACGGGAPNPALTEARSAVGVVQRILTEDSVKRLLKFDGVMLGVGFLFPLLELINSADYLYHSGVLDENSRYKFAEQFETIAHLVQKKDFLNATKLLSVTVMNLNPGGQKSLFQKLTGFEHHASIATPERPKETKAYFDYANSEDFKKRIHVDPVRQLDKTRVNLVMQLAVQDFFVNISETLVYVLNNARVLMYVAEYDAVFPAFNIEDQFRKVEWRGAEIYRKACRRLWHRNGNSSDELRGYETVAGAVVFATVLFGGHYISLDRSAAVSELYSRFLNFPERVAKGEINTTATC
ncbi:hypothetical protein HPB48_011209 [Haemaphysalis longicornis]|uniref:Serine carboxypeptidase n=1 Tax=Haemaphysalis longicornis TaxID=44386 RepID=A0A9J6FLG4_HAELO|nr:hypothetical protein HPB48_011209 [Haemaphysalis longicornis]